MITKLIAIVLAIGGSAVAIKTFDVPLRPTVWYMMPVPACKDLPVNWRRKVICPPRTLQRTEIHRPR